MRVINARRTHAGHRHRHRHRHRRTYVNRLFVERFSNFSLCLFVNFVKLYNLIAHTSRKQEHRPLGQKVYLLRFLTAGETGSVLNLQQYSH